MRHAAAEQEIQTLSPDHFKRTGSLDLVTPPGSFPFDKAQGKTINHRGHEGTQRSSCFSFLRVPLCPLWFRGFTATPPQAFSARRRRRRASAHAFSPVKCSFAAASWRRPTRLWAERD